MASIVVHRAADGRRAPPVELEGVATALLADAHRGVGTLGTPLRSMGGRNRFSGIACTVVAGSLAQWKALDLAEPGQVLVIARGARRDRSEFGAIFAGIAQHKSIAAIVTDGLPRDSEEIARLDIPVFACGTHPFSPADDARGHIGMPVTLFGTRIATGDCVVGDGDGLAVISGEILSQVLERLGRQRRKEEELASPASGPSLLPERILAALARVPLVDSPTAPAPAPVKRRRSPRAARRPFPRSRG
jgi:4-hydroxy-4-methyl-2-oxoglutarate aldolase